MLVFNKETNLPDNVDEKDITADKHEALGTQQITMSDPNGSIHTIPGSSLQKAVDLGWTIAEPKPGEFGRTYEAAVGTAKEMEEKAQHEAAVAEQVKSLEALPPSAYSQNRFVNQALLGVPDIVKEKGIPFLGIKPQTEIEKEAEAKIAEEHPISGPAGAIAGFGAGVFGPVGKAVGVIGRGVEEIAAAKLGTSALAGIASKAAAVGAEGAAFAAPGAATNVAAEDYKAAGESMMWGLGTGVLLGGAFGAGGAAIKGLKGAAPKLEGMNEDLLLQQAGLDERALNKAKDPIKFREKVLEFIKTQPDIPPVGVEGKIGIMAETGRPLIQSNLKLLRNSIGEEIGRLGGGDGNLDLDVDYFNKKLPTGQPKVELPKFADIMNLIGGGIKDQVPILENDVLGERAMNDLMRQRMAIANMSQGGEISFEKLQNLKQQLGAALKDNADPEGVKDVRDYVHAQIRRFQQDAVSKAYTQMGKASDTTDWLYANRMYSTAQEMLELGPDAFRQPGSMARGVGGVLGGAAGTVIGSTFGLPGMAAGMYVGRALGRELLGNALAKGVENRAFPLVIKSLNYFTKNSTLPTDLAGNGIAQVGINGIKEAMSKIPEMLSLKASEASANERKVTSNPIKLALGTEANGLSKDQQYQRVANKIKEAQSNPSTLTHNVGVVSSVFGHDPNLAKVIADQQFHTIQYLYDILPKDPNQPEPYSLRDWKATEQQKAKFTQQLAIVENPMIAVHKLAAGTVQPHEIQTLKDVYPDTYSKMVNQIIQSGYDEKGPKLTYAQKVKVSAFVGQPLDKSLQQPNIASLQAAYNPPKTQQNQPPPKQTRSNKMNGKGPSLETTAGRLERGVQRTI